MRRFWIVPVAVAAAACGGEEASEWAWKRVPSSVNTGLLSVSAPAPGVAWAAGESGIILRWDGSKWSQTPSGTNARLTRIRASSATDVWALGELDQVLRFDGSNWTLVDPAIGGRLKDILPLGPTLAYGVSHDIGGTSVWKWDGSTWSEFAGNATFPLAFGHIAGSSESDMWFVEDSPRGGLGTGARVNHYDGSTFTAPTPEGLASNLRWVGISRGSDGAVWLLGSLTASEQVDRIYRRSGSTWSAPENAVSGTQSVWVLSADVAFAAGSEGLISRYSGSSGGWQQSLPQAAGAVTLQAISGASQQEVWAVGGQGIILQPDPAFRP